MNPAAPSIMTTVRVDAPMNPDAVLDWATRLVGGDPATIKRQLRPSRCQDGTVFLENIGDEALPANVAVCYCPDGPLPVRSIMHADTDADWPPGVVEVSFETSMLFYRLDASSLDLHAFILEAAREWIDGLGHPARWVSSVAGVSTGYQPLDRTIAYWCPGDASVWQGAVR